MTRGKTPTLKSIAERLGVSPSTVSRALSGQGARYRISETTVRAVRDTAAELGFAPNALARGLRLQKTLTIGLVIPDVSNPFFAAIARAVTLEARRAGYTIMLCDTQDDPEREAEAVALLRGRQAEGLVVCPVGLSAEHLPRPGDDEPPVVLVDRYMPDAGLPYVSSDNAGGARAGMAHLLERGHRRIGVLQGLPGTLPNAERLRGVAEAVEASGLPDVSYRVVGGGYKARSGYEGVYELLEAERGPTAFFALSNVVCQGALEALAELGRAVPEDISILCFDDHPYAAHLAAPMTTVTQQTAELGRTAVQRLLARLGGEPTADDAEPGVWLPTQLVERASVRDLQDAAN